jgi:hypothetical protein
MSLPPVTERQLQNAVLDIARLLGYRSYHTYDSRRSAPGLPDLLLIRPGNPGRCIFAELKTEHGRLTAAQASWIADLQTCPVEVYVWRPADLEVIAQVLARTV